MSWLSGLIGSAIIIICSVAIFVQSFDYNIRDRFWPQGISALIIIFCIPLIISQIKKRPRRGDDVKKEDHANHLVWIAIVFTILYLFAAEWIGYFVSTTILMFILLIVFGERNKIMLAVLPIGTMLVVYGVFYLFLRIPLPTGLLF